MKRMTSGNNWTDVERSLSIERGGSGKQLSTISMEKSYSSVKEDPAQKAGAVDDDGREQRTGNMWTASSHVITAVIGSGVLSLAWSIAQLGWIAGPIVLIAFAFVTYFTSILLANCYRSPDGSRNYTYMDAVRTNLGGIQIFLCGLVQYINLFGISIGYTITASISMVAINRSNCFHKEGEQAQCYVSNNIYMAIFGACQILFSQIPDFGKIWWLSIVAAIMSFSYSLVGLGLAVAKVIANGEIYGSSMGVSVGRGKYEVTIGNKISRIFQALGNIAFAYSFSMILIEIQDTLKSPPPENKTMKKASLVGICTTTLFYMSVGCLGYAAFGNNAPGNLLTGFGFYKPYWLIDFANVCIVVHLVGAYQVFCQPLFAFVENWAFVKWPKSNFVHEEYLITVPFIGTLPFNFFRLIWRTTFVIFTTLAAMLLPFFNDIVGLIGAFAFWPLTVYFPVQMYIKKSHPKRLSFQWIGLQTLSFVCLLISIAAALGSIDGVLKDLNNYTPFKTKY